MESDSIDLWVQQYGWEGRLLHGMLASVWPLALLAVAITVFVNGRKLK
ncbi:MAG: hypothetical protein SFU83_19490 [Meiothermus sp.]|nr:hypothetical protein [Meiothermus sp.]